MAGTTDAGSYYGRADMKHPITLGTLVAVLLILSLSACKPRSPNEFGSSIGSALPDKQPSQVVSSTSTPTVDVATDDAVPSFQEIENNIYNITHTPEHPNGADVGPDGIV